MHAADIEELAARNITSGDTDGYHRRDEIVTRGQFASFLARALSIAAVAGQRFADVDPAGTHARVITTLAAAGITTGTTPTTFEPDRTLQRDQMASLLIRALARP